ncbi:hypothetical protein [Georgenia sp. Marseille-Q6866]
MPSGTRNGPGRPTILHGAAPVAAWRRSALLAPARRPVLHRVAMAVAAVAFVLTVIGTETARRGGDVVPGLLISTGAGAVGLLGALAVLALVAGELYGGPHPPTDALVVVEPDPERGRVSVMFRRRARLWTDGRVLGFIGAEREDHRWPLHGADGLAAVETMPLPGGTDHLVRLRGADGRVRGHLLSAQWWPAGVDASAGGPLHELAASAGLPVQGVPYRSSSYPAVTLDHHLGPYSTPVMLWQSTAMLDLVSGVFLALVASLRLADASWAPLSLGLGVVTTLLSALAIAAVHRPHRLSVRGRHGS